MLAQISDKVECGAFSVCVITESARQNDILKRLHIPKAREAKAGTTLDF